MRVCLVLAAILAVILVSFPSPGVTAEKVCRKFEALEPRITTNCRKADGTYVKELPAELAGEMSKIWKRWTYSSDGRSYGVSFGRYAEDGFFLMWGSADREWHIDQ